MNNPDEWPEKLPASARAWLQAAASGSSSVFPLQSWQVDMARALLGSALCNALGIVHLPAGFRLSVVVPVYNEVGTVKQVLDRLVATGLPMEIILVDDGSTDGTREELPGLESEYPVRVLYHDRNRGKGAAVRTGLAEVQGEVVVIQDADLEYNPLDFWSLLQPILQGRADVVYGSRFSQAYQVVPPLWHRAVNRWISSLVSLALGRRFTDVETCYKMMRRDTIAPLVPLLRESRFGIEIELTFRLARQARARFFEVPIHYERRWYSEGKKITWRDGIAALLCIARYAWLRPRQPSPRKDDPRP